MTKPEREKWAHCPECGRRFYKPPRGRPKKYCSDRCRVRKWQADQRKLAEFARAAGAVI